jgi:hypothetical protein
MGSQSINSLNMKRRNDSTSRAKGSMVTHEDKAHDLDAAVVPQGDKAATQQEAARVMGKGNTFMPNDGEGEKESLQSKDKKRKSKNHPSKEIGTACQQRRIMSPPDSEGTSRPIHAVLEQRFDCSQSQLAATARNRSERSRQDDPLAQQRVFPHAATMISAVDMERAPDLQLSTAPMNFGSLPNTLGTHQCPTPGGVSAFLPQFPSRAGGGGGISMDTLRHLESYQHNIGSNILRNPSTSSSLPPARYASAQGMSADWQGSLPIPQVYNRGNDLAGWERAQQGSRFDTLQGGPFSGLSDQDISSLLRGAQPNPVLPFAAHINPSTQFLDQGWARDFMNSFETPIPERLLLQSLYPEVAGAAPASLGGNMYPGQPAMTRGFMLPPQQALLEQIQAPLQNQETSSFTQVARPAQEEKTDQDTTPIAPPGRSVTLYMDSDTVCLSKFQALARKQIELFEAMPADIQTGARGRNNPIVLGQVGIRCRHCTGRPPHSRKRGSAYYPTKSDRVYQTAVNMASSHLCTHCEDMPKDIRDELLRLKDLKSIVGGGKDYWASGVQMKGVIETPEGLRFKPRNRTAI